MKLDVILIVSNHHIVLTLFSGLEKLYKTENIEITVIAILKFATVITVFNGCKYF